MEQYPGGYTLENDEIVIKASNINVTKEAIYARLSFFSKLLMDEKGAPRRIKSTKLNLQSERNINELARTLAELYPLGDDGKEWFTALHSFCDEVVERILAPREPDVLKLVEDPSPHWHVDGFLLSEAPNILFSPGGVGKSFLSLFTAICIENGIDFFGKTQQSKTLYLDWETDLAEANRRVTLITNGMDYIEDIRFPHYLRMYTQLAESLEQVLDIATRNGYRFIVIDSAACAVGGDINDSENVIKFFTAIRKINACGITTLIVSHVSKSDKREGKKSTPIGSIFFENFPRLAWELRSHYEEEKQQYMFGLFCRKSNVGKVKPLGITMQFAENSVVFGKCVPDALESIDEKDTVNNSVLSLLATRSMTAKEVASELGISSQVVWNALSALKKQGKVINLSRGRWAIAGPNTQEDEGEPF